MTKDITDKLKVSIEKGFGVAIATSNAEYYRDYYFLIGPVMFNYTYYKPKKKNTYVNKR